MTNTQHTQGPWRVTENKKFGWYDVSHNQWCEKGETSTVVRVEDHQPAAKLANARLIAAAPELLELLAAIHHAEVFFQSACIARDFIDADKWENARKDALAKIPAAIAKAKGE